MGYRSWMRCPLSNNITRPHDEFVRHCLCDLELARAFFRFFLEGEISVLLELDALDLAGESYINKDLDEVITDLVYTAPTRKNQATICLLVEHKSQGAMDARHHILPFQMREQEVRIMSRGYQNSEDHRYPVVLMLGLYHGQRAYRGPSSVATRMNVSARSPLVPKRWQEEVRIIDLFLCSDSDLMRQGKLGVFLMVLKYIYDDKILDRIREMIPLMQQMEETRNGADFLETVFVYLLKAAREKKVGEVEELAIKSFSRETGGRIMTAAERLEKHGEKRGIKIGEKRGEKRGIKIGEIRGIRITQLNMAQAMIDEGLPTEKIARISKLSIEEINQLRVGRGFFFP